MNRARPEQADTTAEPAAVQVTGTSPATPASAEVLAAPRDGVGTTRSRPERAAVRAAHAADPPQSVDDPLDTSPQGSIVEPPTIRNHRRFALSEVTFDGASVGGATIDAWQNAAGAACWSARVLMILSEGQTAGALSGRTRDGRVVRGLVSLGGSGAGPRTRGAVLVEWHGVSPLRVVDAAVEP